MTVLAQLFRFKGGVKPQTNKTISVQEPIAQAPLPARLFVPLHQSIGGAPNPLVQAGDTVRKGQLIGGADAWVSAAVHAPTSGRVLAVEEHVAAHPSGLPTLCVVIEPDGRDEWIERRPVDHQSLPPERGRERLRGAARAAARCRRRRSRRCRVSQPRQVDAGTQRGDGATGHQRCRVRTVHDLRRHADARARRRDRPRHRHLP